ncbi:MAG TPA: HEAT repeat domain-containing protein [Solirubrobacteraceae bacterium]|nr:HEAT repeat domain-containing protein [Solirubrobacteraceae bacterium]
MHWCYHCYALNPGPTGPCVRCRRPVDGPPDLSFDDRLIWALGHPDGDRAVMAAQTLGVRRVTSALPALRRAVEEDRDPYLAVAALRGAIAIAGPDQLRDWLEELAHSESFMVRDVAQRAIA